GEEQTPLKEGLQKLMQGFTNAKDKQQYVSDVDKKAYEKDESSAYFKTLKQYTMIGFFTSQEGETKASNYVKIPEEYKSETALDDKTLSYGKTWLHY
ncbi:MAG TPA: gluconate 2-dehydrogenase subunit 3 family protein, partial [Flavisolibacter sp.]|nr:gluconate 2-dehydrogenase subunit 3 family protein [Flavisolibacter sp.]